MKDSGDWCIQDVTDLVVKVLIGWFILYSKMECGRTNPIKAHGLVLIHSPIILDDDGRCRFRSGNLCGPSGCKQVHRGLISSHWDVEVASWFAMDGYVSRFGHLAKRSKNHS